MAGSRKKTVIAHPLMINGHEWNREAVMAIVLGRIATTSHGLAKILADGHEGHTLPAYRTIDEWIADDEALALRYARARESQADVMADDIVFLADSCKDHNKCRLQIDARKWVASKLKPKKYGDKVQQELTGPDGGPMTVNIMRFTDDPGNGSV